MEKMYTVKEVADYLQQTEWTIRAKYRSGEITGIKIGRDIRFLQKDINDYLERCKTANREN